MPAKTAGVGTHVDRGFVHRGPVSGQTHRGSRGDEIS